jgi:hypothetical protein
VNVYKLLIDGNVETQGLAAMEVVKGSVLVHLVESAPHNKDDNKKWCPRMPDDC